jgi:lysophospholipase L1-like esterase
VQDCSYRSFDGNTRGGSFNCVDDAYGQGTDLVTGEVAFVDESGADFHLSTGDTVALGAGTDLSAYFTDDIDGDTRTEWSIGADDGSVAAPTTSTVGAAAGGPTSAAVAFGVATSTVGAAAGGPTSAISAAVTGVPTTSTVGAVAGGPTSAVVSAVTAPRVICYGNSFTAGLGIGDPDDYYPAQLATLLGVRVESVVNEGHSAMTTAWLDANFDALVLPHIATDRGNILVLQELFNSIYETSTPPASIMVSFWSICTKARAAGCQVLVADCAVVDASFGVEPDLTTCCGLVVSGWPAYADGCLRTRDRFSDSESALYLSDGLHPSAAGAGVLAEMAAAEIDRLILATAYVFASSGVAASGGPTSAAVAVVGEPIAVAGAAVSVTPQDITLTVSESGVYTLAVDSAAVSLSASAIGLAASRLLAVDSASVPATSTDVMLMRSLVLGVDAASVAVSAQPVGLVGSFALPVDAASVAVSTSDVDLWHVYDLSVEPRRSMSECPLLSCLRLVFSRWLEQRYR